MKKYLLICVTYHSDEALHAFVESIHRAAERVKGNLQVDIEIADNGKQNLGYLGGALPIYNAKAQGYDFVSISNVDIELAPDFFEQLLKIDVTNIGWLAPDIYTDKINHHENPYMLTHPTKRNFRIWSIIYSCTWIYRIYYRLHLLKNKQQKVYPECTIYAGHGSFMLFTKAFVQKYPVLQFRDLCTQKRYFLQNWYEEPNNMCCTLLLCISVIPAISIPAKLTKSRNPLGIKKAYALYTNNFLHNGISIRHNAHV